MKRKGETKPIEVGDESEDSEPKKLSRKDLEESDEENVTEMKPRGRRLPLIRETTQSVTSSRKRRGFDELDYDDNEPETRSTAQPGLFLVTLSSLVALNLLFIEKSKPRGEGQRQRKKRKGRKQPEVLEGGEEEEEGVGKHRGKLLKALLLKEDRKVRRVP